MAANWTTPAKDWTTGDVVTAALLDTHLRDNMDYLQQEFVAKLGQWTSYTPAFTQSAVISKTVSYARSIKIGRMVIGNIVLGATSAGVANNPIIVVAPYTAASASGITCGAGTFFDASTSTRFAVSVLLATNANFQFVHGANTAFMGQTSGGFTGAIASGDSISFQFSYESAS